MQLEEQVTSSPKLLEKIDDYRQRNDVLLALLGEKEEELEACYVDIKEVKNMYKEQIEELMNRVAPTTLTPTKRD